MELRSAKKEPAFQRRAKARLVRLMGIVCLENVKRMEIAVNADNPAPQQKTVIAASPGRGVKVVFATKFPKGAA